MADERIALVGRLASMPQRDAHRIARDHGATVVRDLLRASLVVVGEDDLPIAGTDGDDFLPEGVREAAERGEITILSETEFLERVGMIDGEHYIRRLYTPAMLADLIDVPVALVRRWHRKGLIVPARQVCRLAYFDFQEVTNARRLAELLANGVSPQQIEQKLADLARLLPHVERPLAQLPIVVEGRDLLLRDGADLVDATGQQRLDFDVANRTADETDEPAAVPLDAAQRLRAPEAANMCDAWIDLDAMHETALALEDEGRLDEAAEVYRTLLVAAGPNAETCFHLAEVLARMGDLPAARERYSMAVELDEQFVEARCNLGCVLADLGDLPLATAAFEGALAVHADYPDAHYHLARVLDELGRDIEAIRHWQLFVALVPDSPWAEEARQRLTETLD
ncbi:MAG: tetratricopeptide repeat protein [Pirellulales bacterium]|nr:tetratricopeptide repeat protein [Pirellulales bacterium]